MRTLSLVVFLALVMTVARPVGVAAQVSSAATFNPNTIITDDQLLDTSWNQDQIQAFLAGHTGILVSYTAPDVSGLVKPAAQIIFEAAQAAQINPKFLLTTLQKEESLIEDSSPSQTQLDWATGYGFCDSCTTSTPSIQQYKGFGVQVWNAAQLVRRYLNNLMTIGLTTTAIANTWGPGKTNQILCIASDASGGRNICTPGTTIAITPSNYVTAILYTYTPHPGGNYSFWSLWNGYNFTLTRFYPDGTLLKAQGTSTIYLIQNGLKRRFTSTAAFLSRYSPNRVITVTNDQLLQYTSGQDIAFANYSLLSPPTGGVYLIVDDMRRPIKTKQAFRAAGFQNSDVIKVKWNDLAQFNEGPEITVNNIFPSGILMQNTKTGGIYYVKDGLKHAVISSAIYKSQFGIRKPIAANPQQLAKYPAAKLVGFKDGDLVRSKSGGPTYVISNGDRLPIASDAAAKAYGFNKIWSTVIITDDKSISIHPLGQTLDVTSSVQTASLK